MTNNMIFTVDQLEKHAMITKRPFGIHVMIDDANGSHMNTVQFTFKMHLRMAPTQCWDLGPMISKIVDNSAPKALKINLQFGSKMLHF